MKTARSARERLGYVDESDLDLVLALDADLGGPLTPHLLRCAGLNARGPVRACRSASRSLGMRETDVEIVWDGGVLFVEDKIDASFTPGQPTSYKEAVHERRAVGDQAAAVLVCPGRNLERYRSASADAFVVVTCEELAEIAESSDDRLAHGAAVVLRAAAEPRPADQDDPVSMAWGEAYRAFLHDASPVGVTFQLAPRIFRTPTADWVKLGVAGRPSDVDGPWHWLSRGVVSVYVYSEHRTKALPVGATLKPNKASWRIDLPVPAMTLNAPVAAQTETLRAVTHAAVQLREWFASRPDGSIGVVAGT
jgi:hypothetical protein